MTALVRDQQMKLLDAILGRRAPVNVHPAVMAKLRDPGTLDAVLNGHKVYINRRYDGSVYATMFDFTRFGVVPQKIVRVPFEYQDEPERHPRVLKALERCQ